jgi:hypothetical protein
MSTKKTELDAHEIYAYINQHRLSMAHHWIAVQNHWHKDCFIVIQISMSFFCGGYF